FIVLDRLVESSLDRVSKAEVRVRLGIGHDLERRLEVLDRLIVPALLREDVREYVLGHGIVRRDVERVVEERDRVLPVARLVDRQGRECGETAAPDRRQRGPGRAQAAGRKARSSAARSYARPDDLSRRARELASTALASNPVARAVLLTGRSFRAASRE